MPDAEAQLARLLNEAMAGAAQEVFFEGRFGEIPAAMGAVEVRLRMMRGSLVCGGDDNLGRMFEQAILDFFLEKIVGPAPPGGRTTAVADETAGRFDRFAAERIEHWAKDHLGEFMLIHGAEERRALEATENDEKSDRAKRDLKRCFEEEFEKLAQKELDAILPQYLMVLKEIDAALTAETGAVPASE